MYGWCTFASATGSEYTDPSSVASQIACAAGLLSYWPTLPEDFAVQSATQSAVPFTGYNCAYAMTAAVRLRLDADSDCMHASQATYLLLFSILPLVSPVYIFASGALTGLWLVSGLVVACGLVELS